MPTAKSQFAQHTLSLTMFVLVLGTLSMIWPGIIALVFGLFLLLQSCGAGQEIAVLSWTEVDTMMIALGSLRRTGLLVNPS